MGSQSVTTKPLPPGDETHQVVKTQMGKATVVGHPLTGHGDQPRGCVHDPQLASNFSGSPGEYTLLQGRGAPD